MLLSHGGFSHESQAPQTLIGLARPLHSVIMHEDREDIRWYKLRSINRHTC